MKMSYSTRHGNSYRYFTLQIGKNIHKIKKIDMPDTLICIQKLHLLS